MIISLGVCIILLMLIPSIKNITYEHTYYIMSFSGIIMGIIISIIFMRNISQKLKLIIITCIFIIYRRNLGIIFDMFNSCYIFKSTHMSKVSLLKHLRVYIQDIDKLSVQPNIILCNYCHDRIENFIPLLLNKPITIMMREKLCGRFKLDVLFDVIKTKSKNSFDETKLQIKHKIFNENKYIFVYTNESPYINRHNYGKIRSGVYRIAQELNVPITLVCFDNIDTTWYGSIKEQPFMISVGPTYYVNNIKKSMYTAKKFFRENTLKFERIKNFLNY